MHYDRRAGRTPAIRDGRPSPPPRWTARVALARRTADPRASQPGAGDDSAAAASRKTATWSGAAPPCRFGRARAEPARPPMGRRSP